MTAYKLTDEDRARITYAAGHLISGQVSAASGDTSDPHATDSIDLAWEEFGRLLNDRTRAAADNERDKVADQMLAPRMSAELRAEAAWQRVAVLEAAVLALHARRREEGRDVCDYCVEDDQHVEWPCETAVLVSDPTARDRVLGDRVNFAAARDAAGPSGGEG